MKKLGQKPLSSILNTQDTTKAALLDVQGLTVVGHVAMGRWKDFCSKMPPIY